MEHRAAGVRRAGLRDLAGWALRRRLRFRIAGDSMAPTFVSGQEVLVDPRAFRRRPPRVGDVVLCRHPFRRGVRIVKRVAEVDDRGCLVVHGDNPRESTDSRSFGALPPDHVVGLVVAAFEA
jgi:nickel-type superoxide dismutase maturation protease